MSTLTGVSNTSEIVNQPVSCGRSGCCCLEMLTLLQKVCKSQALYQTERGCSMAPRSLALLWVHSKLCGIYYAMPANMSVFFCLYINVWAPSLPTLWIFLGHHLLCPVFLPVFIPLVCSLTILSPWFAPGQLRGHTDHRVFKSCKAQGSYRGAVVL